jgi:hypothetical protein
MVVRVGQSSGLETGNSVSGKAVSENNKLRVSNQAESQLEYLDGLLGLRIRGEFIKGIGADKYFDGGQNQYHYQGSPDVFCL